MRCRKYDCTADVQERYSLGITAGYWCDRHWYTSGYRKEDASGFDHYDAGEYYDESEAY